MAEREERRLAAILAADMVGYSRLMEADERGTIARQKAHFSQLIQPKIDEHNGRIVKTTGDGLLVEFASVVDAVECAVEIRRAMVDREADVPEDRRIRYRTGINLGDVVVAGDDLLGEGVNVAARLEGIADPGGICISRSARDQIRDKLDIGLEDMGEIEVKNIARPVRVFRVLGEGEEAKAPKKPPQTNRWTTVAATLVLVVALGGGFWWWQSQPDFEPADPAKMVYSLPEKPSIAVLPFDNQTGEMERDYIGDGLAENIITDLSKSPDLVVIARNSTFAYKNKPTKVQTIAEDLGVRYVLEGSVQKSGEKFRFTAQLIDAIDGMHLWAERYERELKDLFAVQDEITEKILLALQIKLTFGPQVNAWRELAPDSQAYRALIDWRAIFHTWSAEKLPEGQRLANQAYKQYPNSILANQMMGWGLWLSVLVGGSKNPIDDLGKARAFAERSLSLGVDAHTHLLLGSLDIAARQYDSAIAHADRAIELLPNGGDTNAVGGSIKIGAGRPAEGVALMKKSIRMSPNHPAWVSGGLTTGLMMLGEFDEARKYANGMLASPTSDVLAHPMATARLAVMAMLEGDQGAARTYVDKLLELAPGWRVSTLAGLTQGWKDRVFAEKFLGALRQAGLPE